MDPTLSGFLGGIIGSVVAGLFVIWSTNRQTMALMAETSGSVNQQLYNQNLEVMRFIAEHPNLHPYFFSNKELSESKGEEEKAQILCTAVMVVGLMDLVAVEINELPEEFRASWERYVIDQYEYSAVVREQINSHSGWYSSGVLKLISESRKTAKP